LTANIVLTYSSRSASKS